MNREEFYIIPENFKTGKYLFNRFKIIDLAILLIGSILGTLIIISIILIAAKMKNFVLACVGSLIGLLIIGIAFFLTLNVPYYHNVLGKIECLIRFSMKTKIYKYKGVDYRIYEEEK